MLANKDIPFQGLDDKDPSDQHQPVDINHPAKEIRPKRITKARSCETEHMHAACSMRMGTSTSNLFLFNVSMDIFAFAIYAMYIFFN